MRRCQARADPVGEPAELHFPVDEGAGLEHGSQTRLCDQFQQSDDVALRMRFTGEIVLTGRDFVEAPRDVGGDDVDTRLGQRTEVFGPVGGRRPVVRVFAVHDRVCQVVREAAVEMLHHAALRASMTTLSPA
jgi:hypothetical protein